MSQPTYTIGQISQQTGLPPKTIRYYEEIKLISPAQRADNGYRRYPHTAIQELSLIKSARDLGVSIEKIRSLMLGCGDDCKHQKQVVQQEVSDYISTVTQQIQQLTTLKTKLEALQNTIDHDGCNPQLIRHIVVTIYAN